MFGNNGHRFAMTGMEGTPDVSVKVKYGDTVIRVGNRHLSDDWATFVERLRALCGQAFEGIEHGQPTRLVYTDDEGDTIAVRSSCELLEAYRCQRGIRKFTVERLAVGVPPQTQTQPQTRTPQCQTEPQQQPSIAQLMMQLHDIILPHAPVPVTQPLVAEPPARVEPSCPTKSPTPDPPKKCKGQGKKGKMNPNQKLLHLIRAGRLRKADTFFQKHGEAGQLNNDFVFLYNGACLYTRMNRLVYAAKLLERSVLAGYRDMSNLMSDSDLNELRRTAEFDTVVQLLRALTVETPRPSVVPTVETAAPVTPVSPATPVTPVTPTTQTPIVVEEEIVEVEKSASEEEEVEVYEYQSTLNTLLAMGIADSPILRQIVTEERGNLANVIERIIT